MQYFQPFLALLLAVATAAHVFAAQASVPSNGGASRVPLYRLFLTDGTTAVSYGEYARVGDEVVFSMPIGQVAGEPRLHLVSLPASWIDWDRTSRYTATVKYHRYIETRAESDWAALQARVTAMLADMARESDPFRAERIADEARQLLVEWPATHYGYRQDDAQEILALIDHVTSTAPAGGNSVQLSLVAPTPRFAVEPMLDPPTVREQIAWLVTVADRMPRAADRIALLEAALATAEDPAAGIPPDDAEAVRRSLETQLRAEREIDQRYNELSARLVSRAQRAASRADAEAVGRLLADLDRQDDRLGRLRPAAVDALRAELEAQRAAAIDLQRRRVDWQARLPIYRRYVQAVGTSAAPLVKGQGLLEGIRDGRDLPPARVEELSEQLRDGATALEALAAPEALRGAHDMLVGAWQFALHAVEQYQPPSGTDAAPGSASSAAAAAVLLLSQAQAAVRAALEPPVIP